MARVQMLNRMRARHARRHTNSALPGKPGPYMPEPGFRAVPARPRSPPLACPNWSRVPGETEIARYQRRGIKVSRDEIVLALKEEIEVRCADDIELNREECLVCVTRPSFINVEQFGEALYQLGSAVFMLAGRDGIERARRLVIARDQLRAETQLIPEGHLFLSGTSVAREARAYNGQPTSGDEVIEQGLG